MEQRGRNDDDDDDDGHDDEPRSVTFDKDGKPVHGVKLKTMASQPFYLRVVRDVSLIEEDICECHFDDCNDLRRFRVSSGPNLVFHVFLSNLYPMKAPVVTFVTPAATISKLQGVTIKDIEVDDKGRLVDSRLVGPGWRPLQGVHGLIRLLCQQLGSTSIAKENLLQWDKFLLGGHGTSHPRPAQRSLCFVSPDNLRVTLVAVHCFSVNPTSVNDHLDTLSSDLMKHLRHSLEETHFDLVKSLSTLHSHFDAVPHIGASVCVATATPDFIECANLGDVQCFTLQTNCRRCRQLSKTHDAFDADEEARLKASGVDYVKHGATVRYIADLSLVSRCVGLSQCSFISREPHYSKTPREAADSVLLIASKDTLETFSALEMASALCPRVSAAEMISEIDRICHVRAHKLETMFALTCL